MRNATIYASTRTEQCGMLVEGEEVQEEKEEEERVETML